MSRPGSYREAGNPRSAALRTGCMGTTLHSPSEYVPGTCNIGGAEAANRRRIGIGGWIATFGAATFLALVGAPAPFYAVLALPAFVGATGLIQSRRHFCAGFGMAGMSNFTDELGRTTVAGDAAAVAADRSTAKRITLQAALVGSAVAAVAIIVASIA